MTLEDRVQAQHLHVFRRAEEPGSVTTACREAGIAVHALDHGVRAQGVDDQVRRERSELRPTLACRFERTLAIQARPGPDLGFPFLHALEQGSDPSFGRQPPLGDLSCPAPCRHVDQLSRHGSRLAAEARRLFDRRAGAGRRESRRFYS